MRGLSCLHLLLVSCLVRFVSRSRGPLLETPMLWLAVLETQDPGPRLGNGDRILEMCRELAIGGSHGPAVVVRGDFGRARIDHRLDGQDHPRPQPGASPRFAVVRHLGLFVERSSDPVTHELADH